MTFEITIFDCPDKELEFVDANFGNFSVKHCL